MTKIYNRQEFKDIRKKLREQSHGVVCEKLLWRKIKGSQIGYRFRRQFSIGRYVVDFYCPQLKLAVEIDGATHSTAIEINFDKERQNYLESLGITLKRYFNIDVKNNLQEVLNDLINACNNSK